MDYFIMLRKRDGFAGQISIVLPQIIRDQVKINPHINKLYLTDIGYYPKARHHYRVRRNGADEHILIYVIDGCGEINLNKSVHTITGNQYIVLPARQSHMYKADAQNPWTIYWIHFTGENSDFMSDLAGKIITISPSENSRIRDRIQLFDEIIENLSLGYNLENLEYSNFCLNHLLASFKYVNQFRKVHFADEKDIAKKAILYMKQNIEKPLTLGEIASQFQLSVPHFSRLFKQRTRYAPMRYFTQLKMQYACQLIDHSNMLIFEISQEIGYDDAFYFSRIFKKTVGISPLAYKKKNEHHSTWH
jgi:AraC family transcriptional regulator, arabinose operon regulatory protein